MSTSSAAGPAGASGIGRDAATGSPQPVTAAGEEDVEQRRVGLARTNARRLTGLMVLVVVLVIVLLLSLAIGAKPVPLEIVWWSLFSGDSGGDDAYIVRELRVPRGTLGVVVGCALGVSGALIQALTRNPLADPGILGVNAGAGFAVTIGVGFFGVTSISGYLWFAFLGAVAVTVLVYLLGSSGRRGANPLRLTLVGIGVGALLGGVTAGITLLSPEIFDRMRAWGAGSLSGRGWDTVLAVLPFVLVGVLLALAVARALNVVALGDDLAASVGARAGTVRVLVIVAVTLLAGSATAAAGPISFVGLMVPHAVRWFTGPDQRWIVAYTVVAAPILLVSADVVGRIVLAPQELQAGIVTAFIGAPVLIVLARRRRVSGL
jgi:iron complex transport system permease protein